MSNKLYDILKLVAVVILPVAELITALGTIWGLPYAAQIAATLTALHTCLGAILVKASAVYAKKNGGDIEHPEGTRGDED